MPDQNLQECKISEFLDRFPRFVPQFKEICPKILKFCILVDFGLAFTKIYHFYDFWLENFAWRGFEVRVLIFEYFTWQFREVKTFYWSNENFWIIFYLIDMVLNFINNITLWYFIWYWWKQSHDFEYKGFLKNLTVFCS